MWEMDYDAATEVWINRDRDITSMNRADLEERIGDFIKTHSTCALATGSAESVRCTPIEYNYLDGSFYLLSEGGLKFRNLKENSRVGLAIFEPYTGFANLKSLQVEGQAVMVEPFSAEYNKVMEYKKVSLEMIRKMPHPMNLIKVVPEKLDYLDADLKKDGFGTRQHLEL